MITFRGTGKKRTENTKYDLDDVLSYQITFWPTSGIPVHIKCFKLATGINSTQEFDIQHVCVLFSGYLPLKITPPIFNMESMLTRRTASLAYLAPPGQFIMGINLFTWTNLMRKNVFQEKTHFSYMK